MFHPFAVIRTSWWPDVAPHLLAQEADGEAVAELTGLPRTASPPLLNQLVPALLAELHAGPQPRKRVSTGTCGRVRRRAQSMRLSRNNADAGHWYRLLRTVGRMGYSVDMTFLDEITAGVDGVLAPAFAERDGIVVPLSDDIVLKDGAVNIDATYLYADLADSSSLAQKCNNQVAAKVMRAYLNACVRILKHHGGEIRSFDGDRVMAVFIGTSKNINAVNAALKISWAFDEVLKPKFASKWATLDEYWTANHGVGIDTGTAMLVRGGVRADNDLISVGAAPNVAAKLSSIRSSPNIYLTKTVYDHMGASNQNSTAAPMWKDQGWFEVGGRNYRVYGTTWRRKP